MSPDGAEKDLVLEPPSREILFAETHRQGVHRLEAGTNSVRFCVNLLDSFESDIRPRAELPMGKFGGVAANTVKRANTELWRWLALACLAFLVFEWWFYHKRTA